jgi:hypothetical protein
MTESPISFIQWLRPTEYHETQTILKSYAQSVNMFHRSVQTKSEAKQAVIEWIKDNDNAQYCFLGSHGLLDDQGALAAIGAANGPGYYASCAEIWEWFSHGCLLGGLWLGACKSSLAAVAFSKLLNTDGNVIPHLFGFSDEIYSHDIEATLRLLIDFSDIDHQSDLADQLTFLRRAIPATKIELYYPAYTLDRSTRYVNVDVFEEEVGVTFSDFLDRNAEHRQGKL